MPCGSNKERTRGRRDTMKRGMIKGIVLFAVFCAGVLGFGQLTNHSNQDLTTEMQDATLPVVSLYLQDEETRNGCRSMNCMGIRRR